MSESKDGGCVFAHLSTSSEPCWGDLVLVDEARDGTQITACQGHWTFVLSASDKDNALWYVKEERS